MIKKTNRQHWQTIKQITLKGLVLIAMYYGPTRIASKVISVIKSKWLRATLLLLLEPIIANLMRYFHQRTRQKDPHLPLIKK